MAEDFARDEETLQIQQGAQLYPVGRALRATFSPDNHDTLSSDVTGLMLDLARVPFEEEEFLPPLLPPPIAAPTGLLARLRLLWHGTAADRRSLRR